MKDVIKMSEEKSANAPLEKFRVGQIVATVWEKDNEKDGRTFKTHNIVVEKNYSVKEGDQDVWKTTSSFQLNELPKVELACHKAYEFLATKQYEKE